MEEERQEGAPEHNAQPGVGDVPLVQNETIVYLEVFL
jgi:hypothetical protein